MPKIVSSSIVSSSDHAEHPEEQRSQLKVYYCLCSEFILVIDADLQHLARRRTDNAIIVSTSQRNHKLQNQHPGNWVAVKKENGYEKQYRYHCPRCELPVAYRAPGEGKTEEYLYIVDAALTDKQGEQPPNAVRIVETASV